MYCLWEIDEYLLLVGGADGLHVVDAKQKKVRRTIPGVPAVFQIQLIENFNKVVMIVGEYATETSKTTSFLPDLLT